MGVFLAITTICLYITVNRLLIRHEIKCNKQILLVWFIVGFFYLLINSTAHQNYKNINSDQLKTLFSFTNESKTYKSNDTLLFIGATSKYIFIRNTKDSTNFIFDKASIKNLSITEKHNTNK